MRSIAEAPRTYARVGGLMYLAIIFLGLFGEAMVRESVVVSGNAEATLQNLKASQMLWRLSIVGDLAMHILDVPLIVIMYYLLKPVDRLLALVATVANVVQTAVLAANKLTLVVPLLLLQKHGDILASTWEATLSFLAIRLHGYGFGIGLLFFGVACLVRGYLVFRSTYFPRTLGVLLALAGLAYLVNSVALLLAPAVAATLFPAILAPALVGEGAFCLWLLVKGVDQSAWERRPVD
jgi:Domain of unknown function (DUF4386)